MQDGENGLHSGPAALGPDPLELNRDVVRRPRDPFTREGIQGNCTRARRGNRTGAGGRRGEVPGAIPSRGRKVSLRARVSRGRRRVEAGRSPPRAAEHVLGAGRACSEAARSAGRIGRRHGGGPIIDGGKRMHPDMATLCSTSKPRRFVGRARDGQRDVPPEIRAQREETPEEAAGDVSLWPLTEDRRSARLNPDYGPRPGWYERTTAG